MNSIGKVRNKPFLYLILAIVFSYYYIEVGFALKPYMILSILFFVFSIKSFVIHKPFVFEMALLLFFGYYCLTSAFAKYPEYSARIMFGVLLILFCYFVMRYIISLASMESIKKALSIGGFVFNIASLILYVWGLFSVGFVLTGNKIKTFGLMLDRDFPRLIGLTDDPNIFAFYNIIFFFFYLTHIKRKGSKLGLTLTATTILLSLSRGAILSVIAGLFIAFLSSSLAKKIKVIIFTPILLFIMNFTVNLFLNINLFNMITERFNTDDNGSGRWGIWSMGIDIFKEHPLFGVGAFNYKPYAEARYGYEPYMHNTYLEVLVDGGVVGLLLYSLIFITIIITLWNKRKSLNDKGFLILSFISISVMMATYSFLVNEVFFLILVLIFKYLNEIKVNKRSNESI